MIEALVGSEVLAQPLSDNFPGPGRALVEWTRRAFSNEFDTVSVCFSKGLGAPMGSALAGPRELIADARRFKQMLGGGFRQAGMMAAGAIFGLERNRNRLEDDHVNATRLAEGLADLPGIEIDLETVQSNMVYFTLTDVAPAEFEQRCADDGVALLAMGPRLVRVVCHLGVSAPDIETSLKVMEKAALPA